MKTFLSTWWDRLRSTYWLFPTLLALGAIALSALTLHLDNGIKPEWVHGTPWLWGGGPAGARSMLATIASSAITVAGVVFSITIVTLTLASSQFGPRLLRNFMTDRGTQLVLGIFVAAFLYCLLVLRAIRGTEELTVVPFLSVTCGIAFAVASVGFLIYFIHHISTSIIAENVIARVALDLRVSIDRLLPDAWDSPRPANDSNPERSTQPATRESLRVYAKGSGYIQAIAIDELVELARGANVVLRIVRRPGQFIAEGAVLIEIDGRVESQERLEQRVLGHVFLGFDRTPTQDIEYAIDQLVEIAVRALSPGVNDPFTALSCVEWLGAALVRIAGRRMPPRAHYDRAGELRIVTDATDFRGLADAALNQVRQFGASSVAVTVRLLDVLARVAPHLVHASDRDTLREHAGAIHADGIAAAKNTRDQAAIGAQFRATSAALAHSN